MRTSIEYLMDTYSGAQLKAQAGTLEQYVEHLDLAAEDKEAMRARIPTGHATYAAKFKEAMAKELVKADAALPVKTDELIKVCMHRAELESEARRRRVNMNGVGAPLAALKKSLLSSSSEKGKGGTRTGVVPVAGGESVDGGAGRKEQQGSSKEAVLDVGSARAASSKNRAESEAARKGPALEDGGKRAAAKSRKQFEVDKITGMREENGVWEYEVQWKACEANNYDDNERTWEERECETAIGGLQKHIDRWWHRQRGEEKAVEVVESNSEEEEGERDEGSKKGGAKVSPPASSEELATALALLANVQVQMVQGQEEVRGMLKHLAAKEGGGKEGGKAAAVKQESSYEDEEKGVLGFKQRWREEGTKRFKSWVKRQQWYIGAVRRSGNSEEIIKFNSLVDMQARAREVAARAVEKATAEGLEAAEKEKLQTRADIKMEDWIKVLEEVYMAYEVMHMRGSEREEAKQLAKIFLEKKYHTPEEERMREMKKEAEKRAKKVRARDNAEFVMASRLGRETSRRQREEDRSDGRETPKGRERDTGSREQSTLRRAEEVFRRTPAWLKGKYVSAVQAGSMGWYRQKGRQLHDAASPGHVVESVRGKCMECGEEGHRAFECSKEEYRRDGKVCVPPLRLYKEKLVDTTGAALE